jgi:hypothetical protein
VLPWISLETSPIGTNNSHLIPVFMRKTNELDVIRKENIFEIIPELKQLC